MSSLSIEELILLNCFMYLNIRDRQGYTLGEVVRNIVKSPKRFEELTYDKPAAMGTKSWRMVLERIQSNQRLCSLTMQTQSKEMGYDPQGLNAVCFLDQDLKQATFVLRGTGRSEWLDNGEAFSTTESPQQVESLDYFIRSLNIMDLVKEGYEIDVTGHLKGGNKAQYITIHSDIIHKCYSYDGQGFSKEAMETYQDQIERNRHKITSIAVDMDYVNCLGHVIAGNTELYQSKYGHLTFLYHHCPDAILIENGLTSRVKRELWHNKMINSYSKNIMEVDQDMKKDIFCSFMGLAQIMHRKNTVIAGHIPSYILVKDTLGQASVEFKQWFSQERNKFSFGQKLVLGALGVPLINLTVPSVYQSKYESFQHLVNQVFGSLSEDIQKEFGQSSEGMLLNKILDLSKKEFEQIYEYRNEQKDITVEEDKEINEFIEIADDLSEVNEEHRRLEYELFGYRKTRDNLMEAIDTIEDFKVKEFCIEKLRKVNEVIEVCKERLESYSLYNSLGHDFGDTKANREGFISLMNTHEIDQLCKITMSIEKDKALLIETKLQKSKIENFIAQIKEQEEVVAKAKSSLDHREMYRDIVLAYRKKIFKKSYRNRYSKELCSYEEAKEYLKTVGVTSKEEYNLLKEKLTRSTATIESLRTTYQRLEVLEQNLSLNIIRQTKGLNFILNKIKDS